MTTPTVAWMLTYLMHSTLWIGGVALMTMCGVPRRAASRAAAWRTALCGGLVTASLASFGVLPHYGPTWLLPSGDDVDVAVVDAASAGKIPVESVDIAALPATVALSEEADAGSAVSDEATTRRRWSTWLTAAWFVGACVMLARLSVAWFALATARRRTFAAPNEWWSETVDQLAAKMDVTQRVEVLISPADFGPACSGLRRGRIYVPETLSQCLSDAELEALVAHELAHLSRRDPAWSIVAHAISGLAFFQPLNWYARRQLEAEAEYAADELAAAALSDGGALAGCLLQFRDWAVSLPQLTPGPVAVAVGMATFRSALGRRVERLVAFDPSRPSSSMSRGRQRLVALGLVALAVILPGLAPRAIGTAPPSPSASSHQEEPMRHPALLTTVAAALLLAPEQTPAADEAKPAATAAASAAQVDQLPEKAHGFMGRVRGTIVDKDPEKGVVTLKITEVQRVWKGSTAAEPESCVGKTLVINGVFGKFIDTLIVLDRGESIDIGARNLEGDKLVFPGELLKKSDPNEKFDKPATPKTTAATSAPGADAPKAAGPIPQGMAGFRGMLRGRVVSKDPEKGRVTVAIDTIVKTWPKNQAKNPQEAVGKELPIGGVFGKFLDVLITVEKGDRIEVEAFHNSGNDTLTFPGEWLKKVD